MSSLFCYCCQGLLNISPQTNKGKRVMWNIIILIFNNPVFSQSDFQKGPGPGILQPLIIKLNKTVINPEINYHDYLSLMDVTTGRNSLRIHLLI